MITYKNKNITSKMGMGNSAKATPNTLKAKEMKKSKNEVSKPKLPPRRFAGSFDGGFDGMKVDDSFTNVTLTPNMLEFNVRQPKFRHIHYNIKYI